MQITDVFWKRNPVAIFYLFIETVDSGFIFHSVSPNQFKSNLLLYTLYYAEACNEFAGPIFASLRPQAT